MRVQVSPVESVDRARSRWRAAAGEIRLTGRWPISSRRSTAIAAGGLRRAACPVHGFSLADVEAVAGADMREGARSVDGAPGRRASNAIAEAPLDALQSADAMIDVGRASGSWRCARDGRACRQPSRGRPCSTARHASFARTRRLSRSRRCRGGSASTPSTGFEDVRLVALTRLLVDVPHVQVDWQLYGPKLAQVALTFGADDVDNVSAGRRCAGRQAAGAARGDPPQHRCGVGRAGRARRTLRAARLMAVVRIGAVSYLNARPLVDGLEARTDRFSVRYDLPSVCAQLLHARRDRSRPDPVDRISSRRRLPNRAGLRRGLGRPRRIGRDLHVDADRASAIDCARHELANIGGADARDGGAVFRHRAVASSTTAPTCRQ